MNKKIICGTMIIFILLFSIPSISAITYTNSREVYRPIIAEKNMEVKRLFLNPYLVLVLLIEGSAFFLLLLSALKIFT